MSRVRVRHESPAPTMALQPDVERFNALNYAVDTGSAATDQGTVFKKSLGQYVVDVGGRPIVCEISNKLRKQLVYPIADPTSLRRRVMSVEQIRMVDPVAIGDAVRFIDAGDGAGLITEVLPRRNRLSRRASGRKPLEQVLVANVDQVVALVAAALPAPWWELLDRYLAAAEAAELPARIVVTKTDLVDPASLADEVAEYRRIGYPVTLTSVTDGAGIAEIAEALRGRVSVFAGESGVGKTTLLNAVQPGLGLRVGEVSAYHKKGKHTTTHLEMFGLDGGGSVVDAPGMREFGLWGVERIEIATLFPELRPHVGRCRFGLDCSHSHEPGCAIKAAVSSGHVSARRHQSYLKVVASSR